jgi:predicted nucleic acid-binding protein
MKTINTFLDTSTVNRILETDTEKVKDPLYEQDRIYLSKIKEDYIEKDIIQFIVNPSVKQEIENTSNPKRKGELLALFNEFHFTPYNKTIFPFTFPAYFITEEEKRILGELSKEIKGFEKDEKIFLDAAANSEVEVLLTTDREHLACIKLRDYLLDKGLDTEVKIFTPKEFYGYLKNKCFDS